MKNSYYLIELPSKNDTSRVTEILTKGKATTKAREKLHTKYSLDGTKVIVQGDIGTVLENFTIGKAYITYLGDCSEDGQAEQSVHTFLSKNAAEWSSQGYR
ncbi:MAG: hypothetical protein M3P98_04465 [bacterium]|nr:hypothetical protein [bacterium]